MKSLDLRTHSVYLRGPGYYLPSRVVVNSEITSYLGKEYDHKWIMKRFGVETRHWAATDQSCSDLAYGASTDLIERFSVDRKEIESLVFASVSPDYSSPPTSPILSQKLNLNYIETLDINAACAGFPSAVQLASRNVVTGVGSVLAVASEIRSFYLNPKDPKTLPLFGDGAAAVLISEANDKSDFRVLAAKSVTQAGLIDLIKIPAGGSALPPLRVRKNQDFYLNMLDGPKIFVSVVKGLAALCLEFLNDLEIEENEIDWLIPHQANIHILEALQKRLSFSKAKLLSYISRIGNTSGSSTGIALALGLEEGAFAAKQKLLLLGAGAGGTGAIVLLEKT